MGKVSAIIGGAVLLFVLAVGGCVGMIFIATAGVATGATDFIVPLAAGDVAKAQTQLSTAAAQATNAQALTTFVTAHKLKSATDTTWNKRHITNNTGWVAGTIHTPNGDVAATAHLVYEGDVWKVDNLFTFANGPAQQFPASPSGEEMKAMLKAQITAFSEGVLAADLSAYHAQFSTSFQQEYPLEVFSKGFKAFIDQKIDLRPFLAHPPLELATQQAGANNITATATYNLPTYVLKAQFRFEHQHFAWRPAAVNFDVDPRLTALATLLFAPTLCLRQADRPVLALVRASLRNRLKPLRMK